MTGGSTYLANMILAYAISIGFVLFLICFLVARWRMFVKAGRWGWKSLIPLYSVWTEYDIVYDNGWRCLLLFVPIVNIYVACKFCFDLADAYGLTAEFGFGLLFLNPIFIMIIGFDHNIKYFPDS